jgi:hypothetical protein
VSVLPPGVVFGEGAIIFGRRLFMGEGTDTITGQPQKMPLSGGNILDSYSGHL